MKNKNIQTVNSKSFNYSIYKKNKTTTLNASSNIGSTCSTVASSFSESKIEPYKPVTVVLSPESEMKKEKPFVVDLTPEMEEILSDSFGFSAIINLDDSISGGRASSGPKLISLKNKDSKTDDDSKKSIVTPRLANYFKNKSVKKTLKIPTRHVLK